jgi:endoglucanase
MDFYFDIMKSVGINAIRVPVSAEWIYYNLDISPQGGMISADPSLSGKTSIEILDVLFDKAEANGMVIMLDLHRLHNSYISELWYSPTDDQYPSSVFLSVWKTLLTRYKDRKNLMAVDLLNEPHGQATWGSGNPSTDWNQFVEYVIPQLHQEFLSSRWLFFVEGINWGHNLDAYAQHPIQFKEKALYNRVVYSSHIYGNSVVPGTSTDPSVLYSQWDASFGFMRIEQNQTLVPGEWGGQTSIDETWMTIFGQYLVDRGIDSNFYWSLMPNSGDVHGLLLDDYTTLDSFKADLIPRLTPHAIPFVF